VDEHIKGACAVTFLAGAIWAAPSAFVAGTTHHQEEYYNNNINNNNPNHPSSLLFNGIRSSLVADAKEMASGSGSRVNKDAESLLRYGLPIPKDKEIRKLQVTIEDIRQDIQSKRKAPAIDGVKKTKGQLKSKGSEFQNMCRDKAECGTILQKMNDLLDPLTANLVDASNVLNGSDQERVALDKAYDLHNELQKLLTQLEEQMVPAGYVTPVPSDYDDLPQLKGGRATVEFILKKPNNAPFDVEGVNYPEAKMTMVIDGFTAPVTGGNFVDLVQKGFYNNMKIQRSDGFVVQTGDPDGPADGYVGTPSKSIGKGKNGERLIPCEIFVKGDKGPFYETTIEDEQRGGEATVLPFSSYGAMGWAREEYDPNSGSSQFFWLLFDSDLTPAGKNVLDGRYPCFGYVTEGADFLRDIKEDDIIVSAKVVKGAEYLVQPKSS
jgi:cyclophilin family peptidyl-prolyl cis-trans isomerase